MKFEILPTIHKELFSTLNKLRKQVQGLQVTYQHPTEWVSFPKVSYRIDDNTPRDNADDMPYTREIRVSIDIWATKLEALVRLTQLVDYVLVNEMNMRQEAYFEIPEESELKLLRVQMKYVLLV